MEKAIQILVNFVATGLTEMTANLSALNAQMNALRTNQQAVTGNMDKQAAAAKKMGNAAGEAAGNVGKLNKNMKGAGESTRKAQGIFANFGKQLVNTALFLAKFAIVIGVFKALEFAIIGTAKAAAEFEAAMKDLQAVANVNNANLERLRDTVFEVAGATTFTALEIVALQKSLARLGFTTEQVIGLTESIARFAEATGESGDEVATFVGKQMKAFQLATVDVAEAVNSYTTAINNSALSLESLATSSQYVSSISNSLGVTFKEQNALLATLSDSGLTASRAGTGLRKIFLELGAEGGSLIPVLDDLGESGITLSEAEELVGDRAAGAILALVEQRESVKRLVDEQENLNSVLLASARQNSTFNGQVKALRAAVDEIVISLGDWVSETDLILNLIERISGKTTLRAFNIVDELGFTPEQIDTAIEGVEKLDNSVTMMLGGTPSVLDLGKAFGLTIDQITKLETKTVKDFEALIDYFREQNKLRRESQEIIDTATKKEKQYLSVSEDLEKFEKGSDSWRSKRDEYYKSLSDRIVVVTEELREYRNLSELRPLTKEEEKQLNIREKQISLLRQERQAVIGNYEAQEDANEVNEDTIKTFKAIYDLRVKLGDANRIGDVVAMQDLFEQLQNQYDLLEKKGLVDAFGEYVALVSDLIDIPSQGAGGGGEAGVGEAIFKSIGAQLEAGLITPAQAKASMLETIENLINSTDDTEVVLALEELARKVNNGVFNPPSEEEEPRVLSLFGLSEEDSELLIKEAQRLALLINSTILDATNRRLDAEQAAIDARYSYEEDRLNGFLTAGIISQEQYERDRLRLEKERVQKTNEIEQKRFNADKINSLAEIAINTAVAISKNFANPIAVALISAFAAAQAATVASQRFIPTKFAQGGKVEGASHEQGGVPFTVQGRGGYEMEGGEYIVNKNATGAFLPLLEQINSFGKGNIPARRMAFANGGIIPQGASSEFDTQGAVGGQEKLIAYIQEENLIARSNTRITNDIRKRL